ncbi:MAG: hypothetical protein ABI680_01480 [Chthoniobacteraceae bacterium]
MNLRSVLALSLVFAIARPSRAELKDPKDQLVFAPITMPAKIVTWRDHLKVQGAWCERVLLAPFATRIKGKPWAAEALPYATFSLRFQEWVPDRETSPEQLAQGAKLIEQGCNDPLVVFLHNWFVAREGSQRKSTATLAEACKTAKAFPGPKALAWMLARLWNESLGEAPRDESWKLAMELTDEVLKDGSFLPHEDLIFFRQLLIGSPTKDLLFSRPDDFEYLAQAPELSEWAQLMFLATMENAKAFRRGFDPEHLAKARKAATRAWELRPDRPDAATTMIPISRWDRERVGEHPRLWFDRAIAAQFDFLPAYLTMMSACSPDAGGSCELILSMGEACLETGRTDTVVPQFYTQSLTMVAEEIGDWKSVFRQPKVRQSLMDLSFKLLNDPDRQHALTIQNGFLALNAWQVGDFATAAKARAAVAGKLPRVVIAKMHGFNIIRFNEQIEFFGQAGSSEYFDGLEHRKHRRYAEAKAAFKSAVEKTPPAWMEMVQTQLRISEAEQHYAGGEWLEFPELTDRHAWFQDPGRYSPWENSDKKSSSQTEREATRKYLMLPIGNAIEIRGEWPMNKRVMSDNTAGSIIFQKVRPAAEPPYYNMEKWFEVQIRKVSSPDLLFTIIDWEGAPLERPIPIRADETNQLHLVLRGGMLTLTFNDRPIFDNISVPKAGPQAQKVLGIVTDGKRRQADPKIEIRLPQGAPEPAPETPREKRPNPDVIPPYRNRA